MTYIAKRHRKKENKKRGGEERRGEERRREVDMPDVWRMTSTSLGLNM